MSDEHQMGDGEDGRPDYGWSECNAETQQSDRLEELGWAVVHLLGSVFGIGAAS